MKITDIDRLKKNIICNLIIIDNFYENPYEIREYALKQQYNIQEYPIPGKRTKKIQNIFDYKKKFTEILKPYINNIKNIESSFHSLLEKDRATIHKYSIHPNRLAAILYLNPDADLNSGTGFFQFKDGTYDSIELQITEFENTAHSLFCYDETIWNTTTTVGNIFNRLVIFNGIQYHKPLNIFGDNILNGRLTQIFAIDID